MRLRFASSMRSLRDPIPMDVSQPRYFGMLNSAWQKTPNFQKTRTSADTVKANNFPSGSIFCLVGPTGDNDSHLPHYTDIALPSTLQPDQPTFLRLLFCKVRVCVQRPLFPADATPHQDAVCYVPPPPWRCSV